jgi:hypothetical protein
VLITSATAPRRIPLRRRLSIARSFHAATALDESVLAAICGIPRAMGNFSRRPLERNGKIAPQIALGTPFAAYPSTHQARLSQTLGLTASTVAPQRSRLHFFSIGSVHARRFPAGQPAQQAELGAVVYTVFA